ncbi:MAG: TVP38/TMEM64 family protein [Desulfovibrionaceae bacterium]|nr:TVP38/TMEM64 family protein [Desulfovibrionaceae bacterium]
MSSELNSNNENGRGLAPVVKGLALLACLGLAVAFIRWAGIADTLSQAWFDSEIKGHGPLGVLTYIGLAAFLMALGMPRQIICFLGGYAFGFVLGTIWASLGSLLGCVLAVAFARFLGRDFVVHRFGPRLARVDAFLEKSPFATAMTIRFFPLGSNLLTNLAAGVSSIPLVPFVLGSSVGYLPQTIVFALFGSGVNVSSGARMALSVFLFLISAVLGIGLYRRHRAASGRRPG